MTSSLEEITLRNMTESPLLRLPGELRNRIYELAVGGNIIVVTKSYTRPGKTSVCLTSANTSGPDAKSAQASIRAPVSGIFTIGLVCRQLHRETALSQYAKNLFHFDNMYHGRDFVDSLSSAQRALLTSISVNVEDYFRSDFSWNFISSTWTWRSVVDTDTEIFLPQLESVYISAQDPKGSFLAAEEEVLHTVGRKLKIGTSRKEGVSLIILNVFRGTENRDQAKMIKLSWNGEAFV